MTREYRLRPSVERYLGPVAIAQFIDVGWFSFWPIGVTKGGIRAFQNGFGRWDGNEQILPIHCEAIKTPFGNPPIPSWTGRLARFRRQSEEPEEQE
jgi:hypothetical protein